MADLVDMNGLTLQTLPQILAQLEDDFRSIYGPDIVLDQNSPDGQMLNIFAQAGADIREIIRQINQSFDPDQAEGVFLDQRVAINAIERKTGSFSSVEVAITTNRAMTLIGLGTQSQELTPTVENLYTVRDGAGNRFFLVETQNIATAGTFTFLFRAANFGPLSILPNSVTTPVFIEPGVTGINNPAGNIAIGERQETDAQLRQRRRVSTTLVSVGQIDSIKAAVLNLAGVTSAQVFENTKDITSVDDIPPHSIWAIVEGGDNTEIATAIKAKRGAGSGMKGDIEINVPYRDGRPFIVKFDRPILQDLYIRFSISLPNGVFDEANLKEMIALMVQWKVGEDATSDDIIVYIKSINPNFVVTAMGVSDDGITYTEVVSPTDKQYRFINDITRIEII